MTPVRPPRELCFSMMPARARSASLACRELRNAAATSGSSTTAVLPAAFRDAYLLGEALLKSYSGRISSLSRVLFIAPSLRTRCRPRADDANHVSALPEKHEPLLTGRMARIGNDAAERITENRSRLFDRSRLFAFLCIASVRLWHYC